MCEGLGLNLYFLGFLIRCLEYVIWEWIVYDLFGRSDVFGWGSVGFRLVFSGGGLCGIESGVFLVGVLGFRS